MEKLFSLLDTNPMQFYFAVVIIAGLLGLAIGFIRNSFVALLEFAMSFSVIRYTVLACLVIFVVKTLVW